MSNKSRPRNGVRKIRNSERGVSLLVTCVAMVVMFGMVGLALDAGRMIIFHNELQTFVDASAIAAGARLDGTQAGVQGANAIATAGPLGSTKPNGWNFDTITISNVSTSYSTSYTGTYDSYATATGSPTNNYRFIKVSAQVTMPLYFLPVVPNIATTQNVAAAAVAGQKPQPTVANGGLAPFAPDAHNSADTRNFGFTPGVQYTLKWGNGNSTTCAGDAGFNPGNAPSEHGFVDLGQGNGNSSLRGVITYGGYPNANSTPSSVSVGTVLSGVPGNRGTSIFDATAERSAQDPDQSSTTYAQYEASGTGNGRRIITVAINDPSQSTGNGSNWAVHVIGFANFLLAPSSTISGTSGPLCGTYIGPASLSGPASGGTDGTQVYSTVLYQ